MWEFNLPRPIQCLICLYIIYGEEDASLMGHQRREKEEKR